MAMQDALPMDDDAPDDGREAKAEELGRLIEAKDWMGLLDLIEPAGVGLMIGVGEEDEE